MILHFFHRERKHLRDGKELARGLKDTEWQD